MVDSQVPISPDPLSADTLLEAAVAAGRAAGALLLNYTAAGFHVEYKNPINLVTDADHAAEQCVIDHIRSRFPSHRFLAEERGRVDEAPSPYLWIIDPLDGTTNFAHGYPTYCVSIGLEYQE
ncbi:MAG: inositol monophosphatase, partial [Nitrospira sp.]|nr:inositol monophosphatase [Nitrospira sp.]